MSCLVVRKVLSRPPFAPASGKKAVNSKPSCCIRMAVPSAHSTSLRGLSWEASKKPSPVSRERVKSKARAGERGGLDYLPTTGCPSLLASHRIQFRIRMPIQCEIPSSLLNSTTPPPPPFPRERGHTTLRAAAPNRRRCNPQMPRVRDCRPSRVCRTPRCSNLMCAFAQVHARPLLTYVALGEGGE